MSSVPGESRGFEVDDATRIILAPAPAFDGDTASGFRQDITNLLDAAEVQWVVVDLQETTYMDSTALGVLIGSLKRARERGKEFTVTGVVADEVGRVFDTTGLSEVFKIGRPGVEQE